MGAAGWTTAVWRFLCLLAGISGLLGATGVWWLLPPVWQGVGIGSGLLVMLLVFLGWLHDCDRSRRVSGRR